jgi:hypothetical protein
VKKLIHLTATLAALNLVQTVRAFPFSNDDLLLVFHDGSSSPSTSDMEYNLGSVSNLLTLSSGASVTLFTDTNSAVLNNFGSYSGAKVLLAAADSFTGDNTGKNVWLSSVSLTTATALAGSTFNNIQGRINSAGDNAANNSGTDNPYLDAPNDINSYSYTAAGQAPASGSDVGTFHGAIVTSRRTDGTNGATLALYQVPYKSSGVGTGLLVGTFKWNVSGSVTYTAGPLVASTPLTPAIITQVTRLPAATQISFTTTNGNRYSLLYKISPNQPAWTSNAITGVITGNNSITNFTDPTTDGVRLYRIQSF